MSWGLGTRLGGAMVWLAVLMAPMAATAGPLADAAKTGDWARVRQLVADGADVRAAQGDGTTALHWAAYRQAADIVELLTGAGADVNAVNDLGVTPLWAACEHGSLDVVERLLQAGADPDVALLSGETPLMTAARSGHPIVVERLLDAGADTEARGPRGQTALMWAAAQAHPVVVDVLLRHGADVTARSDVRVEIVKTSPEPWNPEYITEWRRGGYTPLLFAARVGSPSAVRSLLAHGADVDDTAPSGTSALVVAAHSGHGDVAGILLQAGADPNASGGGYGALHAAILHKDLALVEALLDHGADPDAPIAASTPIRRDAVDFYLHPSWVGATPFWLAARFTLPGIMHRLAEQGADPRALHRPTYWPGSLAARADRERVVEGDTSALMAAVGLGGREPLVAVDRLDRIAENAPVRSTRREPDHADREAVTLEAVQVAVGLGIDPGVANARGDTALHEAAARGYASVVSFLVEHGADPRVRNTRGQTPLDRATEGRYGDDTVDLLRRLSTRR